MESTSQQKCREVNNEKVNEYTRNFLKEKYHNNEEYRNKKKEQNLTHYYKLKEEGKCFKKYVKKFKENHSQYYKEYSEKYNPIYYEKNKERLLQIAGEKVLCECCNKMIRKDYMCKHINSILHKNNSTVS